MSSKRPPLTLWNNSFFWCNGNGSLTRLNASIVWTAPLTTRRSSLPFALLVGVNAPGAGGGPTRPSRCCNLCDDLGLDTISAGATIAFAMECGERGLLREEGLRFGNGEMVLSLLDIAPILAGLVGKWAGYPGAPVVH